MKHRLPSRLTRRRARWALVFTAVFSLVLAVHLVMIQVANASTLASMARAIHWRTISLPAKRGKILDRNGRVLAMDVPRYQVVAAPKYIKKNQVASESAALARKLPFSKASIARVLSNGSWYGLIASSISPQLANKIKALNLTGISVVPFSGRQYPNGTLASQIIGMVGSNGNGLAGVELQYNNLLKGKPGSWVVQQDGQGSPLPQWQKAYTPPTPGNSIKLTVDANIEAVAQKWLKWGVKRAHARNGTVIIENLKTGSIVGLVNWPNFNPNNYYHATALQMRDYAVQDPVPPGSIFKPVPAVAALSLGIFTPNSMFDTRGYKIVDGLRINDWNPNGWGWITLTKAIEVSSDQVFMDVALKLGTSALYHFVNLFGFNHPSGVGLPGDSSGLWVPKSQVNPIDLATMGFGQGFAATPMQMIAADAAVANNGVMMQPHLLKSVISPSGKIIDTVQPKVENRVTSVKVAQEVQHMMTLEATKGTGVPAQVPGYIIAGKTGTAQKIIHGKTSSNRFVASYMGYGPMPHPKFIMLVMINRPVGSLFYGDQVSAPVWKHIATFLFHYWGIKPYATAINGSAKGPIVK